MKWLKKLLGMEPVATYTAPVDAGAKAFDNMAKTLSTPPAPEPKVEAVVAQEVKEVIPEIVKQEEYGSTAIPLAEVSPEIKIPAPKAPRKPRAKKEPVKKETGWPFPGDVPVEATSKPAVRTVKAK